MELLEIVQIAFTLFLTSGIVGTIFWALSSYIGKIWADRYIESVKAGHQKEIEAFKKDLDLMRESSSRYSSKQFELYTSLYHALYDLKDKADVLWDNANEKNLKTFSLQLKKTKKEVEKSYLFLEIAHYEKFMDIFRHLEEYKIGKESLLKLIDRDEATLQINDEIMLWIGANAIQKDEYNRLVDEIRKDFRQQLRGR